MKILLTGVAGFIGWKTAQNLLDKGFTVIGVDNLNSYYDPRIKLWRLETLKGRDNFIFHNVDIENLEALKLLFEIYQPFDAIINLAARAGVRYSMENPFIFHDQCQRNFKFTGTGEGLRS